MREKKQKKEERKRRKAAAKAAAARAGGKEDEDGAPSERPARRIMSDWRGKFAGAAGLGRGGNGDVLSLVGEEKVVVEKRESLGDKFYRQVMKRQQSTFVDVTRDAVFFNKLTIALPSKPLYVIRTDLDILYPIRKLLGKNFLSGMLTLRRKTSRIQVTKLPQRIPLLRKGQL